jgi:hypothetical protein
LRSLLSGITLLVIVGCASRGSSGEEQQSPVQRLPACLSFRFGGDERPELDIGTLRDTMTLTRSFNQSEPGGYVYAGALPDSLVPRSRAMAQELGVRVIGWWTATADSLWISADGVVRAVGVYLGRQLEGVWQQRSRSGSRLSGTLSAVRIACTRP